MTHRVGDLDSAASAGAGAPPPPGNRIAETAVDAYLAGLLPPLGTVACRVHWQDPADGSDESETVSLAALGLRARDVVELLRSGEQAMDELDDRVVRHVLAAVAPRPDARLRIAYREAGAGQIPVFVIAAQCDHLRSIVTTARPLRPTDVVLAGEASGDLHAVAVADPARLVVQTLLGQLLTDANAYLAVWNPRLEDLVAHRYDVLDETDEAIDDAVALLDAARDSLCPGPAGARRSPRAGPVRPHDQPGPRTPRPVG